MATYSITEDTKFPWVKLITINSDKIIDISNDVFNITVKDQLEYFVADHIKDGSTFELEELFKKDTYPTLEISNKATVYTTQPCFECDGTGKMVCPICNGKGYYYPPLAMSPTMCTNCREPGQTGKGTGYVECSACSGDGIARTICGDDKLFTEIYVSTIAKYNNTDYDSLIENGIQFWLDGVTKKTLYIRIAPKGKSSLNEDGYNITNPITNLPEPSRYVGFSIAMFNITLNDSERLVFNCFLLPKVVMGDPVPQDLTTVSEWHEKPHILSSAIRTDFDWNDDGKGIDNLYVNNGVVDTLPNVYTQIPLDSFSSKWDVETSKQEIKKTPVYIVKSSAYISDWMSKQETLDIYDSTSDNFISAARGFDFTSANAKSYLYNEFTQQKTNLSADFNPGTTQENYKFIEVNNQYISDTLYCYEITQYIVDSSCSGMIKQNQVKLELEI